MLPSVVLLMGGGVYVLTLQYYVISDVVTPGSHLDAMDSLLTLLVVAYDLYLFAFLLNLPIILATAKTEKYSSWPLVYVGALSSVISLVLSMGLDMALGVIIALIPMAVLILHTCYIQVRK